MDALKIVPQAFFDAIARVLPGLVALFLLARYEVEAWRSVSDAFGRMMGNKASDWSLLFILVAAYALGHLMTPGTKLIQRISEQYPKIQAKRDPSTNDRCWSKLANAVRAEWNSWTSCNSKKETKSLKPDSKKYDWLRVKSLDAAGLAAKLRAEFTMYNSLAFVFLAFGTWLGFTRRIHEHAFLFALLGFLMAARGRETQQTMRACVENFYIAAGGPQLWPGSSDGEDA